VNIKVLSTNVRSLVIELAFGGRSLTYKRKEMEPRIEHWGTIYSTLS